MLREICSNLIMWDSVEASEEWFRRQIPEIICKSMDAITNDLEANKSGNKSGNNKTFDIMGIKQAHS